MPLREWIAAGQGRSIGLLLAGALALTGLAGFLAIRIESAYLESHSFFQDACYYSFYNARLHTRLQEESRLTVAVDELLHNDRHPLRTVPLVLLAPDRLASRMGHMVTTLPILFLFLMLLGWTILQRTGSTAYALACMFLFSALPGLYHPRLGLGAYWLDLPAALLACASALCLLNSDGGRRLRWLAAFAVVASLTALGRYMSVTYVFVLCAPILAGHLYCRWRNEGGATRTVLVPLAVVAAIIGALAGYFLIAHLSDNARFYSVYGFAVGHSVPAAARSTSLHLLRFLGIAAVAGLVLLAAIQLIWFRREVARDWRSLAAAAWMAAAILIYLTLVVRAVGAPHADLYAAPPLFLAAVAPLRLANPPASRFARLAVFVSIASLAIGGYAIVKNDRIARNPDSADQEQKALDRSLARELSKAGGSVVWYTYFDEYAWLPTMETFYATGKLPLPAGQPFFNAHETAWKGDYPGLTPDEVSRRVWTATREWVDLAVVFDDPAQADANSWMTSAYGRAVARRVAEEVRTDPQWKPAFVVKSARYGTLAGYRNSSTRRGAYQAILTGEPAVRP